MKKVSLNTSFSNLLFSTYTFIFLYEYPIYKGSFFIVTQARHLGSRPSPEEIHTKEWLHQVSPISNEH